MGAVKMASFPHLATLVISSTLQRARSSCPAQTIRLLNQINRPMSNNGYYGLKKSLEDVRDI